ncbi:hypothetical protein GUJ93_ZPchr0010g8738 [Zizania palustris]|uniref:Uncharacterized protein n=1 Tax=Zizania palustris TaxID=103762 RepID=A0A8J5WD29_ZIZPA|nr:hypothetical protein GUJ93_ZPchr0010g8738 [Zizania palustris]
MAGEKCELEKLQEHAELARRRILEQDDDGDASPFAGALLVLSSHLQLLAAAVDEGAGAADVALDVVELLPLRRHQHGHVVEHLVELEQAALQVGNSTVALLDLGDDAQHLACGGGKGSGPRGARAERAGTGGSGGACGGAGRRRSALGRRTAAELLVGIS